MVKPRFKSIQYQLPAGWSIKSWQGAMQACNDARNFIPLSKMTDEQREQIAIRYENRYVKPTQEEINEEQ